MNSAKPSSTKQFIVSLCASAVLFAHPVIEASDLSYVQESSPLNYLVRIDQNSPAEVEAALMRAEQLYTSGQLSGVADPVTFILHGPEVSIFFKDEAENNQALLELAKKLTHLNVVDIKVCETKLGVMGRAKSELVPFVGTVPFGPAAAKDLMVNQGYVHF